MSIRKPAVAGMFYPADPVVLDTEVRAHLASAQVGPLDISLRALIVPHAGYVYSGPTAAYGYRLLEDSRVRRVVMLGPSHYVGFTGLALPGAGAMETPLGVVEVDAEAVGRLAGNPVIIESVEAHRREHSLEVQLPFLQVVVPGALVVPLLTGAITPVQGADIVEPLLDAETLLLVSSDLSHYHDAATARRLDAETAAAITRLAGATIGRDAACGRTAILIAIELAHRAGYRVALLDLRNSGDTAGSSDRVVGYGAFALGE